MALRCCPNVQHGTRVSRLHLLDASCVAANGIGQRVYVEEFVGLQTRCTRYAASPRVLAAPAIRQLEVLLVLSVRSQHHHVEPEHDGDSIAYKGLCTIQTLLVLKPKQLHTLLLIGVHCSHPPR